MQEDNADVLSSVSRPLRFFEGMDGVRALHKEEWEL